MPQKWQTVEYFRNDEPMVAVYRPRSASGGAWVCLAAIVLALVVGGTGPSGDGGSPASGQTAEESTGPVTATVRTAGALPARARADHSAAQITLLPPGATVRVGCHTAGPEFRGPSGGSKVWVQVSYEGAVGFAPAAGLETRGDVTVLVPSC